MPLPPVAELLVSHPLVAYPVVFAGGVLTSLTPCIYPMIPITAAVVGAARGVDSADTPSAHARRRTVTLTLAYVSGLAFAYATLSVRRLYKGEFIGLWSGLGQFETYSYSALWLALGVVILVLGVMLASQVLRIASAALIAAAVLKVFLFDMSELEGVLRALSFIGLGAVLIGIGLFYQRLLGRARPREAVQSS